MVNVIINGICGRMGQTIANLVREETSMKIVGGLERDGHESIGKDIGAICGWDEIDVPVTSEIPNGGDVMIDFSAPVSSVLRAKEAAERGIAMVIGTTGLDDEHKSSLKSSSQHIPCLVSPNMSVGVNILFRIAGEVAQILGESFDIEIVEAHHNQKVDSPSGTAVRLAEIVSESLGKSYPEGACHGRHGIVGERPSGEVGVHAVRGGNIVGDHTVMFVGKSERLELIHRAQNRDIFAHGAIRAARFIAGKPSGMYSFMDVLEGE